MPETSPRSGSDPGSGVAPRVVKTEGVLGGDPRIEGRRIGVYNIYHKYVEDSDSPEEIAVSYGISVAEVHAALAYAFNNPEEMREIEKRRSTNTNPDRVVPNNGNGNSSME